MTPKHWEKIKGNGKNPAGHRWVMLSLGGDRGYWVTDGLYTLQEAAQWDFALPVEIYNPANFVPLEKE